VNRSMCASDRLSWAAVSIVILLSLLLLAACGQTMHGSANISTPTLATTAASSFPTWRAATLPTASNFIFAVAPSNGDIVYTCGVAGGSNLAIWVSHDRAVHWTHTATIPVKSGTTECQVTVDGLDTQTAVARVDQVKLGGNPLISQYQSFATFDGGQTWRQLSGTRPYVVFQLSTRADAIYAYLTYDAGNPQAPLEDDPVLAVGHDQMRTWRTIFQGVTEAISVGVNNAAFLLNPASGALLVAGANSFVTSGDVGAHWANVTVTGYGVQPPPSENIVVQLPQSDQPWHLCVAYDDILNMHNPQPNTLTCSTDSGQTWRPVPSLNMTFTNAKGTGTFVAPAGIFAIADDGAVLAAVSGLASQDTTDYRRQMNGQRWQSFGLTPGAALLTYYPGPGNGVLWAFTYTQGSWVTTDYP